MLLPAFKLCFLLPAFKLRFVVLFFISSLLGQWETSYIVNTYNTGATVVLVVEVELVPLYAQLACSHPG